MCGIIGTVGPWSMNDKDRQVLRNMFYLDTLRGRDSSGAVFFNIQDNNWKWFKAVGLPDAVEEMEGYRESWIAPMSAFIGHNRFATMGKVNVDNAHPFHKGNIIGVHNGTLYKEDLSRLLPFIDRENAKDVTDTEIIYEVLENHPIETVWENISGPATLVWVDTAKSSFNIAVHDKRPLFMWETPNGRTFFASEPWMLSVGITRVHNSYDVRPKKLEKDIHLSFTREQVTFGVNQTRMEQKVRRTKLVPFGDRYLNKFQDYTVYGRRENDHKGHNFSLSKKVEETPPVPATKPKIVPAIDGDGNLKKRIDGTFISKERLEQSQCSWCSSLLSMQKCTLYAEDLQLCDECVAIAYHTESV